MYDLKNFWQQEPAAISEAVRQLLIVLALAGLIALDEKIILAIVSAVSIVLTLFTRSASYTKPTVDGLVADAAASGDPSVGEPPSGQPGE